MASHQDLLNQITKIKEELHCTICTGVIDDPHVLVCGHAFCGVCILQWLPTKKVCPICRIPVMRQPVHVNIIQKLSDIFKALDNSKPVERLSRQHWVDLFPIENQASLIRDVDQDGVIHRCSNCGWELDEENYCERCQISFEGERVDLEDSDVSHYEQDEENLSGFVVSDDEAIVYSDRHDDVLSGDESTTSASQNPIEINDSDDDDDDMPIRRKRNPVIPLSDDDDEEDQSDSNASHSELSYDIPENEAEIMDHFRGPDIDDYETEEEEEFPEDPFERRSVYIDDYADESEEEEERPIVYKTDTIMDSITRAKGKMATTSHEIQSSSDTSDDDNSDAPDYENMTAPLSSSVIPSPILDMASLSVKDKKRKRKHKDKKNKKKNKKHE
ncbi:uncharacterized protein B0P05DRAFT_526559 [Gilbertella persicaria]|uniref:uncharacterized protein n=1 Tax=Gilbertella persicaria TaxID=101096 RepID=UPI00221F2FEB|nr:uncharacterized protein B0P05DRAFT_526559 [Gilbertella persicaria]KAI8091209.1 hypothetical protein B0P05DRAFT_526559 [Gilbertella persicaria]